MFLCTLRNTIFEQHPCRKPPPASLFVVCILPLQALKIKHHTDMFLCYIRYVYLTKCTHIKRAAPLWGAAPGFAFSLSVYYLFASKKSARSADISVNLQICLFDEKYTFLSSLSFAYFSFSRKKSKAAPPGGARPVASLFVVCILPLFT